MLRKLKLLLLLFVDKVFEWYYTNGSKSYAEEHVL